MHFCVFGFLKRHIIKQIGDTVLSALYLHASELHGFFSLLPLLSLFLFVSYEATSKIDKRIASYTLDKDALFFLSAYFFNPF
jgi:uncharacterized membrane protein